jgi:hypothetical protein
MEVVKEELTEAEQLERMKHVEEGISEIKNRWFVTEEDAKISKMRPSSGNSKIKKRRIFPEGIDYDSIAGDPRPWMYHLGLVGIFWFVNHSDHSGGYSAGQCIDIISSFDTLSELLESKQGMVPGMIKDDKLQENMQHFVDLCDKARETGCTLLFE